MKLTPTRRKIIEERYPHHPTSSLRCQMAYALVEADGVLLFSELAGRLGISQDTLMALVSACSDFIRNNREVRLGVGMRARLGMENRTPEPAPAPKKRTLPELLALLQHSRNVSRVIFAGPGGQPVYVPCGAGMLP